MSVHSRDLDRARRELLAEVGTGPNGLAGDSDLGQFSITVACYTARSGCGDDPGDASRGRRNTASVA